MTKITRLESGLLVRGENIAEHKARLSRLDEANRQRIKDHRERMIHMVNTGQVKPIQVIRA